ncbi:LOW QUALITY PROTEIN: hypothetical protein CVT26_001356 [Gymnopilus dilepis]|uniref:Uncharacterized protein n=1 Tax=Gymnopilus dilepis TaxID=231916 RepID=A0A409WBG5_9AGAR|nr:LOW QUALITY PROTEIN: hypothetical protein CVT26_001356 [Gymnopilus dilepis]
MFHGYRTGGRLSLGSQGLGLVPDHRGAMLAGWWRRRVLLLPIHLDRAKDHRPIVCESSLSSFSCHWASMNCGMPGHRHSPLLMSHVPERI